MENFYIKKSEWHSESCACELQIDWNVPKITQGSDEDGFIVQIFTRKLVPEGILNTSAYNSIEYAEAWGVENNAICSKDKGQLCDDMFAVGNRLNDFSEFTRSLDTVGKFEFYGKVYWIPSSSEIYDEIKTWSDDTVKQAAGLRATYDFDILKNEKCIFEREVFVHSWNLSDENKIYSLAKQKLFRFCPNNTKRDEELLINNAYSLLGEKYKHLADKIIYEWKNQWESNSHQAGGNL